MLATTFYCKIAMQQKTYPPEKQIVRLEKICIDFRILQRILL
ncbi:hypothetical protein BAT_0629 [Bacillus pumilus ATCC 7061]|nr:hypothetical protein BAT_0629 [Bacillus pumilus ATCC 7061]